MSQALIIGVLLLGQVDPPAHVGTLGESLRSPARLAVAADGTVLVTDPFKNHIARFDADGTFLGTWSVPAGPIGIAAHPDGRYFVSLRDEGRVAIYDGTFTFVGYLGDGDPMVDFVQPTDLDIAADSGRIYVVDGPADKLYGFSADGSLALLLGTRGGQAGEFRFPSALAVDEGNERLVVADHDNFRIQTFTTGGVFEQRFGYRLKFTPGSPSEGWVVRTQGVAVDGEGRIYVADAQMSTVRVFDATGSELAKLLEFGTEPGDLRTPCDVALSADGTRLYVVSTNTSTVEVYEAPDLGGLRSPVNGSGGSTRGRGGTNWCYYDFVRRASPAPFGSSVRSVGWLGLPRPLDRSVVNDAAVPVVYDGPHMLDDAEIICGRCHGFPRLPGGHEGLVEGQGLLCMSCHTAGGQALTMPIHETDVADPYGLNPAAADGQGVSHAWGTPAVNPLADSVGPAPGSPMALYLDDGNLKCATCHDQHSTFYPPYLRFSNNRDAMCKECHEPRDKGPGEGGTHPVGFAYPGGAGEFPPAADVAPLYVKGGRVECMTCHGVHGTDSGGANDGEGDGMLLRAANDETLCMACHTEHIGHTPTGDWQPACGDCHDIHDPANMNLALVGALVYNRTLDEDKPVVFTARSGPNSFADGDPAAIDGICEVCHTATRYHREDGTGMPHHAGATCTDCHPHGAGFLPTGGCIDCHSVPQDNGNGIPPGGRPAVVNPDGSGGHHLSGEVLTDDDCVVCHEMTQHMEGQVRLWADPTEPVDVLPVTGEADELVPFCDACHVDMTHPTIHTVEGAWEPVCTECHEIHDPANVNLSLVADVVYNRTLEMDKPVIFLSRTGRYSFADSDPEAIDGICQVCHTDTRYHQEDGSGLPHHGGADCTVCHPHAVGFLPAGGGCIDCHGVPQDNGDGVPPGGRRAVAGEFPADDPHAHFGLELDDEGCQVCHSLDTHMDGYVELRDPDDGSIYRFVYPDDLPGDPDVSNFCGNCHDADGAANLPNPFDPFGDGNAPPDVASRFLGSLQWSEWYGDSCFSEGGTLRAVNSHHDISDADQGFSGARLECLNCHGSHIAGASQPLADPSAATSTWAGTDNEFCLACHFGGAGPADPGFPAGVVGPSIALKGIESCDYDFEPWYVSYTWTHSAHGHDSKRGWDGYSGAPAYELACADCHDPHGSYSPANPEGNPYMIRDFVDGTAYVDDGYRLAGFIGPPWDRFGTARNVVVTIDGLDVGWGGQEGLCAVCHVDWLETGGTDWWHDLCTGCQTCHGHGATWGEHDWEGGDDDTPCPPGGARAAKPPQFDSQQVGGLARRLEAMKRE